MTANPPSRNRVRELRKSAGFTQAELGERAGISRTAVTAIEGERLVPSVSAALALAQTLGTTVEVLFGRAEISEKPPEWAWDPQTTAQSYWQAEVGGQNWLYPAETAPMYSLLPDGNTSAELPTIVGSKRPLDKTLVVACCDPAAGLLASEFAQATGQRMLILPRSSREALKLMREGKVHVAGLHLSTPDETQRNAQVVREVLGNDYQLLRIARWQEGIAVAPSSRIKSVRGALRSKLRWVGREPGSGARQCLDPFAGESYQPPPRRTSPSRCCRRHPFRLGRRRSMRGTHQLRGGTGFPPRPKRSLRPVYPQCFP